MSAYSVCIPRIFSNIPDKKIIDTFEKLDLGKVENMDIVLKPGKNGSTFKMAFIHFSEWNDNYGSAGASLKKNIENPNIDAKLVYDDPWYWILLPNNSSVQTTTTSIQSNKKKNNKLCSENELTERITNLEDDIHCIYEELYKRKYFPVKDRDEDIETYIETDISSISDIKSIHSLDKSVIERNLSPMTIDELYTPTKHNIIPYSSSSDTTILSNSQEMITDYDYDYYENESSNSENTIVDKHWMTEHFCGND